MSFYGNNNGFIQLKFIDRVLACVKRKESCGDCQLKGNCPYHYFHILIRHLLRKVSSLCYFYHGLEWKEYFVNIIKQAEEVALTENNTDWHDWERYSYRQHTKMKLGGLIGEAVYKGPLNDFWPLLKLGELVHIGKGSVFGLGKYQISGF